MTMNVKRRMPLVVLALVACWLAADAAFATGPYYESSTSSRMSRKFMRGVGNVALGFMEIPKSINEEVQTKDAFTGTFTGLFKGTGLTLARMGVGVFEIVTFPAPVPRGYKPIIEPEFVMGEDTRTWKDRVEDMEK
ncbi:MAG: exosortase system-associated protein, TIGR04073 family [Candidatus Sumerlaeota bacterium]|nr:exosortase system-associated protein, TIGR04073 family [Candidatus Sumerlaeota bacterium]